MNPRVFTYKRINHKTIGCMSVTHSNKKCRNWEQNTIIMDSASATCIHHRQSLKLSFQSTKSFGCAPVNCYHPICCHRIFKTFFILLPLTRLCTLVSSAFVAGCSGSQSNQTQHQRYTTSLQRRNRSLDPARLPQETSS